MHLNAGVRIYMPQILRASSTLSLTSFSDGASAYNSTPPGRKTGYQSADIEHATEDTLLTDRLTSSSPVMEGGNDEANDND